MSFGAWIRPRQFLQHLQCVGLSDPTGGGWGGRTGRLADVCFPPAGSAEQFMNDSPHCQADSLLPWGLAGCGAGGAAAAPSVRFTHTRARAHTQTRAGGAPAGLFIFWGPAGLDRFPW